MKHRTAAIAALITLTLAGCTAAQPADAVTVPTEELDAADDPVEQNFERREALLERQSREADALDREFAVGEYYEDWDEWTAREACEAESMTYDELDACNAQVDGEAARREQRGAEYDRRLIELAERHDEELDALDRELSP